ncbi:MAG: phage portal protein [Gemmatimonadota bacterium]
MGILARMERRSTLNNPSTSLIDFFTGGSEVTSGVRVNNVTALNISAVWAAVRVLTDSIAVLSLLTHERVGEGKQRAPDHPLYSLLKLRPNPYMSAFTFWETFEGHIETWGNAYAEIERDRAGRPIALWPLRPDKTTVHVDTQGRKFYVTRVDGQEIRLPAEDVLHVPGFGFDGFQGYNPITKARESLGLTMAAEKFGASFFGSGAKVAGVLKHNETLGAEATARLRKDWEDLHTGLSNSHRVAILEEGMDFTQIGVAPEDAQFLGTRKFQISEVARWFKVPPHMIGDLERSTNNNIEHQSLEFLKYTILPRTTRIEQAVNHELFSAVERAKYFAEFNVDDLLRGDTAARSKFYREMWGIGAMTQNEIRAKENMNPVDGGDRRFVPLNMVPDDMVEDVLDVSDDEEDDDPPPPPPESDDERNTRELDLRARRSVTLRKRQSDSYQRIIDEAAARELKKEIRQVRRGLKSAFGARDGVKFRQLVDEFYEHHNETVRGAFIGILRSYLEVVIGAVGDELGSEVELNQTLERFLEEYADAFGTRWAGESAQQLRALIRDTEPDEVEEVISQRLDEWEQKRSAKIAHREANRSGNAFAKAAYETAGVLSIRWFTVGENCVLCDMLDGRVIAIADNFLNRGEVLDPEDGQTAPLEPRSHISHPPLHGGCNCFIVANL